MDAGLFLKIYRKDYEKVISLLKEIWEFMVDGKHHVIRRWLKDEKISVADQAKLDLALSRLRKIDFGLIGKKLLPGPLPGTKVYKLRLRCANRELRPMLCRGPVGEPADYTLLLGALEKDNKMHPGNAPVNADLNRRSLIDNPNWREHY